MRQDTSARLRRLQDLFAQALELPPEQRLRWLDALDSSELETIAELRRLLARDEQALSIPDCVPVSLLASALSERTQTRAHATAGSFILHEELGHGGMGCVFRGVRVCAGARQEAAIKILRPELRHGAAIERFLIERRMLARLEHPGIARLLDAGETADGTPFVAMELIRGQPLLEYCAEKRLGITERIGVFRQLVAAVMHAHRALVVHRDIKPSNVMVDDDGRVRLLDFGIAKGLVEEGDSTVTANRYFTPAYAAPEQLTGGPITVACDVYSLGALLYELLCGSPPFRMAGMRAVDIERLILATPPRPMEQAFVATQMQGAPQFSAERRRQWRRSLRGELESIVQCALRKEPDARYPTAAALDEELQNWLEQRPVSAAGAQWHYRVRKFVRRNIAVTSAAAMVIASVGIALVLVVQQSVIANRERDRAREALRALGDAFVAADPTGLSGGEVSARSILDAASRRISAHVARRPEVYAELAAEVGSVQLALGVVDADDTSMAQALRWAEGEEGQEALAWRLSLLRARRLVAQHAFDQADAALIELERKRPTDALVKLTRGKYWMARSEPSAAIPYLTDVVDAFPDDVTHVDRVDAQWQLAEAQRLGGNPAAALDTLDALSTQLSRVVDAHHGTVLLTRLRRLDALLDLGRVDEATAQAQALSVQIESTFGRKSSVTALTYSTLALALVRAKRYRESIEPYRSAATAYAESLGSNHVTTARSYFNLALMQNYVDPSNPESATGYRRAIASASAAREPSDPLVTFFRIEYAKSLLKRGETSAAREVLLPENVVPDLDSAGPDIATAYREQLALSFGSLVCPPAPSAMPAKPPVTQAERAVSLYCAAELTKVGPS